MSSKRTADWLRYVPPVAALGTAFVLQTIIVTDLLGNALASIIGPAGGYGLGVLFGLSVASCAEGGAAYLMDLYDKHLLARDSVWLLKVAMVVYVAGSGLAIHWWLSQRHLPTVMSWLLAGMSASALFLWSRGARWRNREAMRTAGQIDPALPRLPLSAKALHPVRWLVTLYLISWRPVNTTDEARVRFQEWTDRRSGRTARTELYVRTLVDAAQADIKTLYAEAVVLSDAIREGARAELSAARAEADAILSAAREVQVSGEQESEQVRCRLTAEAETVRRAARNEADAVLSAARAELSTVRAEVEKLSAEAVRLKVEAERTVQRAKDDADTASTVRAARPVQASAIRSDVSVEQLADTLGEQSPDRIPGRPTAIGILRRVYGSCSNDRAIAAIEQLRTRRGVQREPADRERLRLVNDTPDAIGA